MNFSKLTYSEIEEAVAKKGLEPSQVSSHFYRMGCAHPVVNHYDDIKQYDYSGNIEFYFTIFICPSFPISSICINLVK